MKLATPKGNQLKGGGTYLKTPGKYHVLIEDIQVGLSTKGKTIDGSSVTMKVLAGEHKDKTLSLVLWNVNLESTDKAQEMTIKRLTNFFIAANVLKPDQLGEEVEFDESSAGGATIVAEFAAARKKNDNEEWVDDPDNIDWCYSEIYHVDDPKVKDVPKSAEALELIDGEHRHSADWFNYREDEQQVQTAAAGGGETELFDDI